MKNYLTSISYSHNGITFGRSISNSESRMRQVFEFVEKHGSITRLEFQRVYGPQGMESPTRVRPGYGSSFWTACVHSEFLTPSRTFMWRGQSNRKWTHRDGYLIYRKGRRYHQWKEMIEENV